jgi:pimeloyl-ACP methyl ester carboxylesterase
MEQFRRGDLVFDVIDDGPADGPVAVLLHGFPEQHIMWRPVIDRLTAQGYRCLAPLQRGYSAGARPKRRKDYRISELGGDIIRLMDLADAERVHLVGHDWGAGVAWWVASKVPDRLLDLTALSVPHPAAMMKAAMTSRQALASWYMFAIQIPYVPEWVLRRERVISGFIDSRSASETVLAEAAAMREPGMLTGGLNWYRGLLFADRRDADVKIAAPTMYVWSDGDGFLREKGARLCGDYVAGEYRFEKLEGISHWILDELLLDWFSAHPGS